MQDLSTRLAQLRRNRLLTRAARHAMGSYARRHHLPRILDVMDPPTPVPALIMLLDTEAELENARKTKAGHYSVTRHIEVLAAIMSEARFLRSGSEIRTIT